jgi:16S rRNA U1498 N3-methylase RsmE
MRLEPALSLSEIQQRVFLPAHESSRKMTLFAYEGGVDEQGRRLSTSSLRLAIEEWRLKTKEVSPEEIWLFIGGEGGYSRQEVETFRALGCDPVSLGDQVLRVETACVSLIAIVLHEFRYR